MSSEESPEYSPFFAVMGASAAMVFSALGAAYGTAKSGTGIAAHVCDAARAHHEVHHPRGHGWSFLHLGAGLSVGLSGLAAGFAIGIVGDAGVRGTAQQPRLFVGMILILIFAEVLGLYGLIVALILSTK
ncbi:hypothetical protein L3Q82_014335 [Scortum barcoo]|uniref:Uncharacterized protein n=1 Tax=Scortum barcoo TaxID=214431 RepID=A0ACB8VWS1_9TELE|nr:hypothetical protein L3Q82_014335 [Scortum barcoo]